MTHYFDESPGVASDTRSVDVALPDLAFTMDTDRGVFSHGHLDAGTSLLLREAPAPAASGDLLDLGCGAGPIALTMAKRSPGATVWATDVNDRARHLTLRNAARNHLSNINACTIDDLPVDVRFSTIWSNPPIRIGKSALHTLLLDALGRLTPTGDAVFVVHKHLGADSLQRWLTEAGWPTDRIASRGGFRLLHTTRTAA